MRATSSRTAAATDEAAVLLSESVHLGPPKKAWRCRACSRTSCGPRRRGDDDPLGRAQIADQRSGRAAEMMITVRCPASGSSLRASARDDNPVGARLPTLRASIGSRRAS